MIEINWSLVERFQTLIAGLLALFAATLTVFFLHRQIRQTERHHLKRREKKFYAARAVLPLVLSRLCHYADNSSLYAVNGRGVISEEGEITEETPTLPDDITPLLKDIIEYGDTKIAKSTFDLISEIQVHHDRLTSLPKTPTTPLLSGETLTTKHVFDTAISDAAYLHVHATNFFDYARDRTNETPSQPTKDQVKQKLFFLGIEESKFPEVYNCVESHGGAIMTKPPPGEFDIIERYFAPLAKGEEGAFGLSDDAAVLKFTNPAVITTDTLVRGVHFLSNAPPAAVAAKALRVNLSDLAAMGAAPRAYTLALTLDTTTDEAWIRDFAAALARDQETYGVTLIGGDTVKADKLSITITAFGEAAQGDTQSAGVLRRSGAKAGDRIWVSGTIGDGVLGLRAAGGNLQELPEEQREELINRYLIPEPRLALGPRLVGLAGACIDVSDGLIADLGHICRASGLSAIIEAAEVPLSEAARAVLDGNAAIIEELLTGGDDYELLFSAPVEAAAAIRALAEELNLPLNSIGSLEESEGAPPSVRLVDGEGREIVPDKTGYKHF